ncbi:unnamed protein product, partial [Effrenium voratum]
AVLEATQALKYQEAVAAPEGPAPVMCLPEHVKLLSQPPRIPEDHLRDRYKTHNDWDAAIFQYRLVGEPVVGRGPFTEFASYLDD